MVGSARTRWQTSLPLMSGSMTSRMIRSGRYSLTIMPASKPLEAIRTSKRPSSWRALLIGLDEIRLVVHQQDLPLAALQGVGRDAVVLHELVQGFARDAPELASRGRGSP